MEPDRNHHKLDRSFHTVNDQLTMEMTTRNSHSYHDELRSSYYDLNTWNRSCQSTMSGDGINVVDFDKNRVDWDVHHTTKIDGTIRQDHDNDPCTVGRFQDNTRYVDGDEFWTHKMNDYHESNPLSLSKNILERGDENNTQDIRSMAMNGSIATTRRNTSPPPLSHGTVSCKMIQVAPGEYMRLRGAQETWKAVQQDFYIPGTCICCQETLFCIQDAVFVLCPICDVVSPSQPGKILISDGYNGGVGLGFVIDELIQWQTEILASRKPI